MYRVSGNDGQLFLVSDPAPFTVWLDSDNGWDWYVSDPAVSFWGDITAEVSDGNGCWLPVVPDEVRAYTGSLTLSKCSAGPVRVSGVCFPLSRVATGSWEVSIEAHVGEQMLGGERTKQVGRSSASLWIAWVDEGLRSFLASEDALARLVSAQAMFYGKGRVSDTGTSFVLSFNEEGVQSGRR